MRHLRFIVVLLALAVASPLSAAAAPPTTVDTTELGSVIEPLDGKPVRFSGEAIGEALRAPAGRRWITVLNDGVAVGVVVTEKAAASIDGFGDWDTTGAIVDVVGVYNVACDQHAGDLDVHADELRVLSPAQPRLKPVQPIKAVVSFVILAAGAVLVSRYRTLRRRSMI